MQTPEKIRDRETCWFVGVRPEGTHLVIIIIIIIIQQNFGILTLLNSMKIGKFYRSYYIWSTNLQQVVVLSSEEICQKGKNR